LGAIVGEQLFCGLVAICNSSLVICHLGEWEVRSFSEGLSRGKSGGKPLNQRKVGR
jgi:hypothetical protein